MSTEPDYNFNETAAQQNAAPSLALPFALVSTTLAIFMFAQTSNTFFTRENLREGTKQLEEGKKQLADAGKTLEKDVDESTKVQKKVQDIILDLLLLAKTDDDAKAIVQKYNIQQQAPAGGTPAPAPAPAPTP